MKFSNIFDLTTRIHSFAISTCATGHNYRAQYLHEACGQLIGQSSPRPYPHAAPPHLPLRLLSETTCYLLSAY